MMRSYEEGNRRNVRSFEGLKLVLLFFLLTVAGAIGGSDEAGLVPVWPVSGVALAIVLSGTVEIKVVLSSLFQGVVLGKIAVMFIYTDLTFLPVLGISSVLAILYILEVRAGYSVYRKMRSVGLSFDSTGDVTVLLLTSLSMSLVFSVFAVGVLWISGYYGIVNFHFMVLLPLLLSHLSGALIFIPIFKPVTHELSVPALKGRDPFLVLSFFVLGCLSVLSFFSVILPELHYFPYIAIPVILFVTIRGGQYVGMWSVLLLTLIATFAASNNLFVLIPGFSRVIAFVNLQGFIVVNALMVLYLGAIDIQRKGYSNRLNSSLLKLERAYRLVRSLHDSLDLGRIADNSLDFFSDGRENSLISFYLKDRNSKNFRLLSYRGLEPGDIERVGNISTDSSLSGLAWSSGHIHVVKDPCERGDIELPIKEFLKKRSIKTVVSLPLTSGGKVLGVVNILYRHRKKLKKSDADYLSAIAREIGMALSNSLNFAKAQIELEDRKRAEENLKQNQDRLEMVLSGADLGSWELYVKTEEIAFNDRWAEMIGYDRGELNSHISSWESNIHPEDKTRVMESLWRYLRGVVPEYKEEYRLKTKSGETLWILDTGSITEWDINYEPFRMSGIHMDITREKEIEIALEKYRRELESILSSSPAGIGLSRNRVMSFANERLCEMTGYKRGDLEGTDTRIFYESDDEYERVGRVLYAQLYRGRMNANVETVYLTKEGDRKDVFLSVSWLDQKDHDRGISFACLDITDWKKTEREKRDREARFRTIFQEAPIPMVRVGLDYTILEVNRAYCSMFGYTAGELKSMKFQNLTAPESLEDSFIKMADLARGKALGFEMQKTFMSKKGKRINGHIKVSLLRDGKGEPLYYLGQILDISELLRVQSELEELNRTLEIKVDQRTRELKAVNQELESFAYSVSHDLKAPLRGIDGFSQALIEDYGEFLPGEGRGYLERVRRAASRMGELIEDLLRLSRITRKSLVYSEVDLGGIAIEVEQELRSLDPEREVEIIIESGMVVRGDEGLLRSVIQNLMSNAWKFTSREEIARIKFFRSEDGIFCISDNGVGFDQKYEDMLFTVFQRLHANYDYEGTGIGLATVKRIIARHGGQIWARGKDKEGASFCFTLDQKREGSQGA